MDQVDQLADAGATWTRQFHPLGFAIAVGWLTEGIWFSAMLAWLLKLTILFIWGVRMFRFMKPFFLGLILGEVAVGGVWGIIYSFTTDVGRVLTAM